jgi:polyisoprenoid-binding protein YceI
MTTAAAETRTTWTIDPSHTTVEFVAKHMMITTVKGRFAELTGTIVADETNLADSSVEVTLQAASLGTHSEQRDAHLRSPDFFDAEVNPQISFVSTEIVPVDDETYRITGDLTMHGITRPVTLHAEIQGFDIDPWGNERVGLEISGQINRSDWDMKFNQALGSGNMLVSDKVKLALDISAIKQAA